ncbi:MAG: alpha/beta hydrolase-fold protein [Myxococcota bacterium]
MKTVERWLSPRLHETMTLARWGHFGQPVLLFPTAGGDAEEAERFLMLDALAPLVDSGRIKVYSVDSVAGRAWVQRRDDPRHCTWTQTHFDACVYYEVVPAIHHDCRADGIEIVTAGASIGAFNAVAALCRHPDAFGAAVAMSGTFDLEPWLGGHYDDDFYFSSPLHFVPQLTGAPREVLRRRFVLLACGGGRWEDPEQSWRMAHVLGAQGVPNRVDPWGPEWDHDWPTWRRMLPQYLDELTGGR